MDATADGNFSEITIHPDGRVYVFGLTSALLEVLADLPTQEECWRELHEHVRQATQATVPSEN